jgi:hypothetical protein
MIKPLYVDMDKQFKYTSDSGENAVCSVDIYIRGHLVPGRAWGLVLVTQIDSEPRSIALDIPVIASEVMMRKFLALGMNGVQPKDLIWLEYYPVNKSVRRGRMERVTFKKMEICVPHSQAYFDDPVWHRYSEGVVEKLMGMTWKEMGLPELKRYVE